MLNIDTFLYIEKIIAAEKSICDTYRSQLSLVKGKKEKDELSKLFDQHKSRYNALLSLLGEENF